MPAPNKTEKLMKANILQHPIGDKDIVNYSGDMDTWEYTENKIVMLLCI